MTRISTNLLPSSASLSIRPRSQTADLQPNVGRSAPIGSAFSVYLDWLRFAAAIIVMLHHSAPKAFGLSPETFPGHDAVIIFFVMSGFIISFVTDRKKGDFLTYGVDRLSRLWIVSIPAIILGLLVSLGAGSVGLADLKDCLLNLFFLGESWGADRFAPHNAPMWSLNYEAWYYLIFGIWTYSRSRSLSWLGAFIACLAAGPKIILLFPIWIAGVILYRHRPTIRNDIAVFMLTSSVCAYAVLYIFGLHIVMLEWFYRLSHGYSYLLGPSSSIIYDYLLAVVVVAQFVAVENILRGRDVNRIVATIGRKAAGISLTIYLFHTPCLDLLSDVIKLNGMTAVLVSAALLPVLANITEKRRYQLRSILLSRLRTHGRQQI